MNFLRCEGDNLHSLRSKSRFGANISLGANSLNLWGTKYQKVTKVYFII